MKNKHGGGAKTNINSFKFEEQTQLSKMLAAVPGVKLELIDVTEKKTAMACRVFNANHKEIGLLLQKNYLYQYFLMPNGVNYAKHISAKLLPDEAFVNHSTRTVYIIEKKSQDSDGSVDEKIQTCGFKLREYKKLFNLVGYDVKYIYLLSDWFKAHKYKDMLEYVNECDCEYYFENVPLDRIGLIKRAA